MQRQHCPAGVAWVAAALTWACLPRRWRGARAAGRRRCGWSAARSGTWRGTRSPRAPGGSPWAAAARSPAHTQGTAVSPARPPALPRACLPAWGDTQWTPAPRADWGCRRGGQKNGGLHNSCRAILPRIQLCALSAVMSKGSIILPSKHSVRDVELGWVKSTKQVTIKHWSWKLTGLKQP